MDSSPSDNRFLRISPPDLIVKVGAVALAMLALFLLIQSVVALKEYRYVGSGMQAGNTISVQGEGEVFAVPDIATFSVTIQEEKDDVQAAQETATAKANDIILYLKGEGIEDRDIKTADYSVYPQYDWVQDSTREGVYTPGRQVLRGYQVSQTISVKVRDTEKAGGLLSGVGSRGASNVSGLSFTIDDEDALKADARKMAIEDARAKAEELAGQLGVRLVRITGFYEDSSGYPMPYAAMGGIAMDMMVRSEAANQVAPAPEKYGKQIRFAERRGIPFVWFPQPDGTHQVRDIRTGDQTDVDPVAWMPPEADLRPTLTGGAS